MMKVPPPATNHFPRPALKKAESVHVQVSFQDLQRIKAEAKSRKMTMSRMMRLAFEQYVGLTTPDPDAPTDREILDNLTSLRDAAVQLGNATTDTLASATADLRELRSQIADAVVRVRAS